jgi:hypothetical protein
MDAGPEEMHQGCPNDGTVATDSGGMTTHAGGDGTAAGLVCAGYPWRISAIVPSAAVAKHVVAILHHVRTRVVARVCLIPPAPSGSPAARARTRSGVPQGHRAQDHHHQPERASRPHQHRRRSRTRMSKAGGEALIHEGRRDPAPASSSSVCCVFMTGGARRRCRGGSWTASRSRR